MAVSSKTIKCITGIAFSIFILSGCATNMKVPIKDPASYSETYDKLGSAAETMLVFKDDQPASDKAKLLSGRIPMQLTYQEKPFDAIPWIAVQTVKEMQARGLPVRLAAASGESGTVLSIKRVHIENHRVSGFSPFVTFTSLRADVDTPQGPQRITAYIKRGKVPVWSFDEVIDPTYNDPLSLLTKELGAKLNQRLFHQVVSTDKVNALIAKIDKDAATRADAYLDVYQLGFSNNPAAVPALVRLSTHSSEYVRLAALSSLGILQATEQIPFLISRYETKDAIWQDRAMALKAIGDMATPESQLYIQQQWAYYGNKTDNEALWTKEIIALYLDAPGIAPIQNNRSSTVARAAPVAAYQAPFDPNAEHWIGLMSCEARMDNPARGAYQGKFAMEISGNVATAHRLLSKASETLSGRVVNGALLLQGEGYLTATPGNKWQFKFSGDFAPGAPIYSGRGNMLSKGKAVRACELVMTRAENR